MDNGQLSPDQADFLRKYTNTPIVGAQQPQQPAQQQNSQPQMSGNPMLDNILQYGLPAAGGILGGAAGGLGIGALTGGAGAVPGAIAGEAGGASLGQYAADKLTGQQPGWDVPLSGGLSLLFSGMGIAGAKGAQALLDHMAGSEAMEGFNLTGRQIAKYAQKYKVGAEDVVANNGLNGANPKDLDELISTQGKAYDTAANQKSVPLDQQAFIKNYNDLKAQILGGSDEATPGDSQKAWDKLHTELSSNVFPTLGITEDEDGNLIAHDAAPPSMSDGVSAKRNYDAAAGRATRDNDPAQSNLNLNVANLMRDTLNDSAEIAEKNGLLPGGSKLKQLGINLKNLYGLNDMVDAREGAGKSGLNWKSIGAKTVGAGLGSLIGSSLGPLGSILGAGTGLATEGGIAAAVDNPLMRKIIGNTAQAGAKTAGSLVKPMGIAGAGAGADAPNAIMNLLGITRSNTSPDGKDQNTPESPSNGIPEQQIQNNQNSQFQNNTSSQSQSISNGSGAVNMVKLSDGSTVPSKLPNSDQIANMIPGQIYPVTKQVADLQKIQSDYAAAGLNPLKMQQADNEMSIYNAYKGINDQIVQTYLQQAGLSSTQSSFVMSAPPVFDALNDLQAAIQSKGGQGIFQTLLNSSPMVQTLKAKGDPTGQYGHMLQLMNYTQEEIARMYSGGAVTDQQSTLFQNAFSPGNNTATNLQNINQAMKQMYEQYQQYTPFFHLQMGQTTPQQQQNAGGQGGGGYNTGSDLLNGLLQKAGSS